MKKNIFMLILIITAFSLYGQVTLEESQRKARELYPSLRQTDLLERAKEYSIDNANTRYLPRLSLSGKASYQSDVTSLPIALPGITLEDLPKDQYQIVLELSQPLWDGGRTSSQKAMITASSLAERKILDVEIYSLRNRVNQIFFGILLLEEQLKQNALLTAELETNYNRVLSLYNFGMAKTSDLDTIRVEQLKADQKRTEILSAAVSYRLMLSGITGIPLNEETVLVRPETEAVSAGDDGLNRPEIAMYQAQKGILDARRNIVASGTMPLLNLFLQGGYGRPGLNMLDTEFSSFYLTGIRLNWPLDGFYTRKKEIETLEIQKEIIDSKMETFIYNTGLQITAQEENISRLKELIEKDAEIIALRTDIKKDAEIQLENGTMSVNDLIGRITEENLAIQTKSLHEIQLLQTLSDLKYTINE